MRAHGRVVAAASPRLEALTIVRAHLERQQSKRRSRLRLPPFQKVDHSSPAQPKEPLVLELGKLLSLLFSQALLKANLVLALEQCKSQTSQQSPAQLKGLLVLELERSSS